MNGAGETSSIVICGAGVIGSSVAYQLALRGVNCIVIEKCDVACAASGKAGGFLALDWCDGSPLRELARLSFAMHDKQAVDLGEGIGYRKMEAYAVSMTSSKSPRGRLAGKSRKRVVQNRNAPDWITGDADLGNCTRIATSETSAQVHPRKLSKAYLSAAARLVGTSVKIGNVINVHKDSSRKLVTAVVVETAEGQEPEIIPCSHLVLTMGPWTINAQAWFSDLPPIMANKATSIVLPCVVPGQAVFSEFIDSNGDARSPEAYPRPDELYICGGAAQEPLPSDPTMIEPHADDVSVLVDFAEQISASTRGVQSRVEQACYLPISPDGVPLIGQIPGMENAFVGAGHGCWGILNSPGTGKALAELLVDGESSSVNLAPFAPSRFLFTGRTRS